MNIAFIFKTLAHYGVQYVLVGSVGAACYGARVHTQDVDICHATGPANLQRLAAALRALDAELIHVPPRGKESIDWNDWHTLRLDDPTEHHLFKTPYGAVDVLPSPTGAGGWGTTLDYETLAVEAHTVHAFGLDIQVAAFETIMASKLALGRPQDQTVTAELQRIAALLARGEQPDDGLERFAAAQQRNPR